MHIFFHVKNINSFQKKNIIFLSIIDIFKIVREIYFNHRWNSAKRLV